MTFWSKLLGAHEPRQEDYIWDTFVDFCNEGMTLISLADDAFSDGPHFETTRLLLDRMDEFIRTISKEIINYDDIIFPVIFNVQLRPHVNVPQGQKQLHFDTGNYARLSFAHLLEFFNLICSTVNGRIGEIRGQIDYLDFLHIAEVIFKEQSYEFFQNWLLQWEEFIGSLSNYRLYLKSMKKFWLEHNVAGDYIFPSEHGLLYWLELEIGKTTMIEILRKWFERDGSITLTISSKTPQLLTVLEREVDDKIAVFIDDIDEILELLTPEQKEQLFDRLQVIRKSSFVFYTSSTITGQLTVYDYGRLGLNEAIKYTTY